MKFENKGKWLKEAQDKMAARDTMEDPDFLDGDDKVLTFEEEEELDIEDDDIEEEPAQKNEASSLQALNKELANNVETLYLVAKHVRDRFKYRTLQNMSYDEAQAEKIYDQIEAVIEDAVKKLATINAKVIG